MTSIKLKIKKGDTVKILSGKDKGKTGKVLSVLPVKRKLVVEGVNLHAGYERSKQPGQPGTKVVAPSPIDISNAMLVENLSGQTTRVGFKILEDGSKIRISKKSGKAV